MNIAIVSDIHDHITHLLLALHAARECERMIFLGDMVHSSTFCTLLEEWQRPLDLVFGNNEYERETFQKIAEQHPLTTLHGNTGTLQVDQRRLFFCHLPYHALQAAQSGRFDAVFYGHTHCAHIQQIHHCLLANPGEVLGRSSSPSIGIFNTTTQEFRTIAI